MQRLRGIRWIIAIMAFALLATACGGADDDTGGEETTETSPGEDTEAAGDYELPEEGVYTDRIDYGLIVDQTGPTAGTQVPFEHGFKSYVARVNRNGGIHGRQVNVLTEDEKYEVPVGVAAYNKLVEQTPVLAMTALNNSSFQAAVIEDVDENGVPILGAQSTTQVAVNPFREYFFALLATYGQQADTSVAFAINRFGLEEGFTAATFVGNVASGQEWENLVGSRVEKAGGEMVGNIRLEYGSPNADSQGQEMANLDPDVIFMHGGTSIGIAAFNSFEKFGLTDTPIVGIFALEAPSVAEASQEIGDQFYAVNNFSSAAQDVEGAEQVIEDAQAEGYPESEYLTTDFTTGYVEAMVAMQALENAGPEPTREKVKEGAEQLTDFDTLQLSGAVSFGPDNRIGIKSVRPYAFNYDEGHYEPVGPYEDYADCFSNSYIEENIDAWDPSCASEAAQ